MATLVQLRYDPPVAEVQPIEPVQKLSKLLAKTFYPRMLQEDMEDIPTLSPTLGWFQE